MTVGSSPGVATATPTYRGSDDHLRTTRQRRHKAQYERPGKPSWHGFAGLARKEVIDYIKSLVLTSVQLLPIYSFVRDAGLIEKGLTNYWGYKSHRLFAADPRYFATGAITEFQTDGRSFL